MEQDQRARLWVELSDLWLDNELDDARLRGMAQVVRETGVRRDELTRIFRDDLAPILGPNQRGVAGEWAGFDPEWLVATVRQRRGRRSLWTRFAALTGWSTRAARPAFDRVCEIAFEREPSDGSD